MRFEVEIDDEFVDSVIGDITDNLPEACQSFDCSGWDYKTKTFRFYDYEEDEAFTLGIDDFRSAFRLMFTDKWPRGLTKPPLAADDSKGEWDNWLCQHCDGDSIDAFVQLARFGEVIYG